ncbi:unnamed protein product [Tenebrio molitor]|nr:unnamed protein product [Tenebrio molitor]
MEKTAFAGCNDEFLTMCLKCRIQQNMKELKKSCRLVNSVKQEGNELKTDVACVCSTPFQWGIIV